MDRTKIVEKLKDMIFLLSDIEDDMEIGEDDILNSGEFGLDSLLLVQLIVEIEREFNITIDDEYLSMDFLSTLGTMADFILEAMSDEP